MGSWRGIMMLEHGQRPGVLQRGSISMRSSQLSHPASKRRCLSGWKVHGTRLGGSMRADELPPPVQMTQLLAGFQLSQALYAAAVLGVADRLVAGPAPVAVLTERTAAH